MSDDQSRDPQHHKDEHQVLPSNPVLRTKALKHAYLVDVRRNSAGPRAEKQNREKEFYAASKMPKGQISCFSAEQPRQKTPIGPNSLLKITSLHHRFWIESALALTCWVVLVVTLGWQDWIEALTGLDPDHHSGWVEWLVVVGLAACSVTLGFAARSEWRRGGAALPTSA
ncbi:MAG: hypothetical protein WB992_20345 [Bryobacteraceae bacterium]